MPRQKSLLTVIRDLVQQEGELSNAVVARQPLYRDAREERAPPSQASAWSGPSAGLEE